MNFTYLYKVYYFCADKKKETKRIVFWDLFLNFCSYFVRWILQTAIMKFSLRFIFISTIFSLIFINKFIRKCHGEPKVMIGNTRVEGIHMLTRNNRNISGFMGIPYAEPPIGLLRFVCNIDFFFIKLYL